MTDRFGEIRTKFAAGRDLDDGDLVWLIETLDAFMNAYGDARRATVDVADSVAAIPIHHGGHHFDPDAPITNMQDYDHGRMDGWNACRTRAIEAVTGG